MKEICLFQGDDPSDTVHAPQLGRVQGEGQVRRRTNDQGKKPVSSGGLAAIDCHCQVSLLDFWRHLFFVMAARRPWCAKDCTAPSPVVLDWVPGHDGLFVGLRISHRYR